MIWLGVAVATAGLYLLCVKEGFSVNKGDLIVLLSALLFAVHILVIDRFSPLVDSVKLACIQFFVTAFLAAIPMLIFEKPDAVAIAAFWAPLLYLGIVSGGIAYTLQILGQKNADPAVASLIMSLESVFAAIFGVLILNESFTARETIGCALMFTAIIVSQLDFRRFRLQLARRRTEDPNA